MFEYFNGKVIKLKSLLGVAKKMIKALKELHQHGYIHRDVKPDNVCIDKNGVLTLIDFEHMKKVIKKGMHIPINLKKFFYGALDFAPIASHQLIEQSFKDDLESVVYSTLYMWSNG